MKNTSAQRKWIYLLGIVLLLYSISGFFLIPVLVQKAVVPFVQGRLAATISVSGVRFNPYRLSLELNGITLKHRDGSLLAGIEKLYFNLRFSSLVRWALTFEEVAIVSPHVSIERHTPGAWNFGGLLKNPSHGVNSEQESVLPRIRVDHMSLKGGTIDFADQSRPTPFLLSIRSPAIETVGLSTFGTRPGHVTVFLQTADGETLNLEGDATVCPLQSEGIVRLQGGKMRTLWRYIQDQASFEIRDGTVDLTSRYRFQSNPQGSTFSMTNIDVAVSESTFRSKDGTHDFGYIQSLDVDNAQFDLTDKLLHIHHVGLRKGTLRLARDARGTLDWGGVAAPPAAGDMPAADPEHTPRWKIGIDEVTLEEFSFAFHDAGQARAVTVTAHPIRLTLTNLTTTPGASFGVACAMRIEESGDVVVQGTATALPPSLDASLKIESLPLLPLQPYLESLTRLSLVSGTVSVQGRLQYGVKAPGLPLLRFVGNASIEKFASRDRVRSERFAEWEAISFNDVTVDIEPHRVRIGGIQAKAPFFQVRISEERTVNIMDVMSPEIKGPVIRALPEQRTRSSIPVEIGTIAIERCSAYFQDLSLVPQVAAAMQGLSGTVTQISSAAGSRADINLHGKVPPRGTVSVSGKMNLFVPAVDSDLSILFRDVELTTLSPYSGKFAGYVIKDGRLSLDLNYKLSKRNLAAENKVVISRLTLGERTNSPDAVDLPVRLAVALLKDANGVISFDLPVRGTLDDPEFSLKGIFFKALKNFLLKIVSSPFRLLGSIVGREDLPLDYVAFPPGSSILSEGEDRKLSLLAQALSTRPILALDIRAAFHPDLDRRAIQEARFEECLSTHLARPSETADAGNKKVLEALYKKRFGSEGLKALRDQFNHLESSVQQEGAPPPVAGDHASRADRKLAEKQYCALLRSRLVESQPVSDEELLQLARNRATAVKDHLTNKGTIPAHRLLIGEPGPTQETVGDMIKTYLAVNGV